MVFAASDEKARLTTRGTLAARRRSSCPSLPTFRTFEMFQRVAKNANGENCYTVLLSSRLKLNLESCCFLPPLNANSTHCNEDYAEARVFDLHAFHYFFSNHSSRFVKFHVLDHSINFIQSSLNKIVI